jgi:hypothetical protein
MENKNLTLFTPLKHNSEDEISKASLGQIEYKNEIYEIYSFEQFIQNNKKWYLN